MSRVLMRNSSQVVLATIPDSWCESGSRSKLTCCKIGYPGCQYTQTVNLGTVLWVSSNQSELGGLSECRPVGASVDSYNALVVAV